MLVKLIVRDNCDVSGETVSGGLDTVRVPVADRVEVNRRVCL